MVKLRPEDFRAGTRNKHIDAFSVSPKGFIVGATNHGEVYLWKINFNTIRQRKVDGHYNWVNTFKLNKKGVAYLDFNQSGDILMCGSSDGTAALYDTSFVDKSKKQVVEFLDGERETQVFEHQNFKDMDISEETVIYKFQEKNDKVKLDCAIDSIAWSAHSRYAIVAMNIKKASDDDKNNQNEAFTKIKVYDTYSGEAIENLDKTCDLGKKMKGFLSVIKAHPFDDNILLGCYDAGINILYDI